MDEESSVTHEEPDAAEITFSNGRKARLVSAAAEDRTPDLLEKLGIQEARALICVFGGADSLEDNVKPYLRQLFSRGIVHAAIEKEAVILDGGTHSGVMALIGEAAADRDYKALLLGVAPAAQVMYPGSPGGERIRNAADLDPNHNHFLLTEGQKWGDETRRMFEIADFLTSSRGAERPGSKIPVAVVLAGGSISGIARNEVVQAVRRGWPVIVIEGSGELADRIAWYLRNPTEPVKEPDIAEIVEEGSLALYPLHAPARGFKELVLRQFSEVEILRHAWQRFAIYDTQAVHYQWDFYRSQVAILALGVVTTLLIIISTLYRTRIAASGVIGSYLAEGLVYAVILLPITTSALLAFTSRLNPGNKWVLLRSSAEAIKRAIYLYRTRPVTYPKITLNANGQEPSQTAAVEEEKLEQATRESELNSRLQFITSQLMQSEVNLAALPPYGDNKPVPPANATHREDDGLSALTPERYITLRLDDQLGWYKNKTVQKERNMRFYQAVILAIGGLGTFLAAIRQELWVAFTTSLATALTTYLQTLQVDHTLVQYNQTATNLENIKCWWLSLTPEEQARRENVDRMVRTTETVLETETVGWMQQMQDALAGLREEQAAEEQEREFKISASILKTLKLSSSFHTDDIALESLIELPEEEASTIREDVESFLTASNDADGNGSEET